MSTITLRRIQLMALATLAALFLPGAAHSQARNFIAGNLVQFDDNGIWTWYSDERAVYDPAGNKLVVGCVENAAGIGGIPRDGNINVTIWDPATGNGPRHTLRANLTSFGGGDDHNAPGLLAWPNGKYVALYTGHNADSNTWYRVYDPATETWAAEAIFDWLTIPVGLDFRTTYSNPNYLAAEGLTYNFARSRGRSPNFIVSTDFGSTWTYGGELTTNANVGYVNGYFRFWGNGVDRIDFIATEYHPRDFNNSMYHGYVSNRMSFRTDGTVRDTNIFDTVAMPTPQSFTTVFAAGTILPPGQTNYRCWNSDVCRYADGTIACIISTRINNNTGGNDSSINPNHAFFYCRWNGSAWSRTYLCQAGYKLYASEADYVGLGALDPADPNTIYLSTAFDPRAVQPGVRDTNAPYSSAREIWKGVSTNQGSSFTWTPITDKSVRDNFRPIMPQWDANNKALIWFRGVYTSAQTVDAAVIGLVEQQGEIPGRKTYVDATAANTFFADGSGLVTGSGANQWHELAFGNGGALFSSADAVAENAPMLMTQVTVPAAGTYDLWVNFWGNTNSDWRVTAGMLTNQTQVHRQMAGKEVDPAEYADASGLVLTNNGTNLLYQAYVGRVTATGPDTFNVYVDDHPYLTGNTNQVGAVSRTWYDGVSYAALNPFVITSVSNSASTVTITWNSPRPETALTRPSYTVWKKNLLTDAAWTSVATGIPSAGFTTSYTDSIGSTTGFYRVSWP